MKKVVMITTLAVATLCTGAIPLGLTKRAHGAKLGEGKRMSGAMVNRTKYVEATNVVAIADGVWKTNPGGLFGKKFGEKIADQTVLKEDRTRGEFYVSFTPEKKFRSFLDYRLIVDPRTRFVYGISCVAKITGRDVCEKELEEVKSVFRQKFPNASSQLSMIGYGDGGGGWVSAHWDLKFEMKHPDRKGRTMTPSEITIRAIDQHFFPPVNKKTVAPSPDLDAL